MKLHFTRDWLRSHIENDPDIECDTTSERQSMTTIPDEWVEKVARALNAHPDFCIHRLSECYLYNIGKARDAIAAIEQGIRDDERERIATMIETEIPPELSLEALAKIIRNRDTDNG